jgi:ATP-dependent protease ClpP protease subunit
MQEQQPNGSAGNAPARNGIAKWFSRIDDVFILKSIYRALIVGSLAFLAVDFSEIYQRENQPLPGKVEPREPVKMEPPKQRDQVRPYLPLTNPVRQRSGEGPQMPGYTEPPSQDKVGARMTFLRGPKGALSAVGRIELGTAAEMARFIESQGGEIKSVHLHSPGGSVNDALAMSKLLREKSIDTIVPDNGYCASSCPIVFSGGKSRIAGKRAWIGVHQIYAAAAAPGDVNDGLAHGQAISAEVQDHLVKMGVNTQAWIHAMRTPSDQLYVFTPEELTDYKLATQIIG